jgi:fructuronate reductase/mannitol 2-dehydrogenase
VALPTYDRGALTPSVVHIGVGGFTRAHQLVYFDEIAQRRISDRWGVVGLGLHNPAMQEALAPQDYLYTVVERGAGQERARVVGSLVGYRFAPQDPEAALAALGASTTRLVTLTITGDGYRLDPRSGEFDPDDAEVQADLRDPDRPRGALGMIVAALDRRRRAGSRPFTVLSCDNLQRNGRAARTAVVGFARLRDEVLARWIGDHVTFPCSMVDRITRQTTAQDRRAVAERFGVDDRWPVITEPFSQWVVEDAFCDGRPPLDLVGARFTTDVRPYELMKTRLLNATHSALGYLGRLAGHTFVHEALADPVLRGYAIRLMQEEVCPLLPPVPGVDLGEYTTTLLHRLADPALGDRLERLCERGSTKMPSYLLPSLHEAVQQQRPHALLTLAVAAWFHYLRGRDTAGNPTAVRDPRSSLLQPLALAGGVDPRPLLAVRSVFGDLGRDASFVEALAAAMGRIERNGVRTAATATGTVPRRGRGAGDDTRSGASA